MYGVRRNGRPELLFDVVSYDSRVRGVCALPEFESTGRCDLPEGGLPIIETPSLYRVPELTDITRPMVAFCPLQVSL